MTPRKRVSIITPVFNEERAIDPFYQRLSRALAPLRERLDFELIFTNNRSSDGTAERILALRAADPSVQLLTLSRNFGYQQSMLAGLRQASGDAICLIDVDCEDPPEMLVEFIRHWEEGYDLVYGVRDRRAETVLITWMRKIFYRVNRMIADSDIIVDMAEFSLMTADVRDAVVSSVSTFPFLRAEIAHFGFKRMGIRYDRQRRSVGESHFNFYGMTRFAIAGILSSTTVPLRLALYLLPPLFLLNALAFWAEVSGRWAWGFELLAMADLLYLCTALAIVALYTARNYRNVVGRPLAVVDWRLSALNLPRERSPNDLPRQGPRP
jgi:dolichol-phosphate mannosyltransferase